jgi:hypothetical protein
MNNRTMRGINMGKAIVFMFIALYLALNPSTATAVADKMYVANTIGNTVSQANLDGTGGVSLGNLNGTLTAPQFIALDLAHGKMYVVNSNNYTVSQANLDGTGGISLGNLNGTLNNPVGIALDLAHDKMYVANYFGNTVSQANLDGTGGVSLGTLNGTLNRPVGIALSLLNCDVTVGQICYVNCDPLFCPTSYCYILIPGLAGSFNVGEITYSGGPASASRCVVFIP